LNDATRVRDFGAVAEVASSCRPCLIMGDSAIACPVVDSHGQVIGILQAIAKTDGQVFSEHEVQVLEEVAQKISLSMEGSGSSLARLLQTMQGRA